MAKFKKKKSSPTPESDDSKMGAEQADIPQIENIGSAGADATTPETPSSDLPIGDPEKSEKDRKLNRLFWMRVGLAVLAGTASTFIFEDIEGEDRRWASIGFMILVFFGTIMVAKSMNMQLPHSDRKKLVTQGIGSYIFLYLFVWIVTYTFANSAGSTTGISMPVS